jgi:predicted Zn-dependent protease
MTVRHPKGIGSGWAGLSGYDWTAIDGSALAQRALEKCLASIDPKRIEPGRYTVVLEPQAVSNLVDLLMVREPSHDPLEREFGAEAGQGPFPLGKDTALDLWRTKTGLKIIDERITISHDPSDPLLGVVAEPGLGPTTWINRGVLTSLSYTRRYALGKLGDNLGALFRPSYRMSGGNSSVEEMIRSTQRGLLVTRFSNLRVINGGSLLATGVTRDGLWLIENGKISHAVKNMRITESPLFVLNQIVDLGEPVPIFRPSQQTFEVKLNPAIVPPIKANDFSFTSTIDAV